MARENSLRHFHFCQNLRSRFADVQGKLLKPAFFDANFFLSDLQRHPNSVSSRFPQVLFVFKSDFSIWKNPSSLTFFLRRLPLPSLPVAPASHVEIMLKSSRQPTILLFFVFDVFTNKNAYFYKPYLEQRRRSRTKTYNVFGTAVPSHSKLLRLHWHSSVKHVSMLGGFSTQLYLVSAAVLSAFR